MFRPIKETKPTRTDIQKLKEWAEQVQLDPNDPSNADLIEYIKVPITYIILFFRT